MREGGSSILKAREREVKKERLVLNASMSEHLALRLLEPQRDQFYPEIKH